MEPVCSCETLVDFCQTIRRNMPEDRTQKLWYRHVSVWNLLPQPHEHGQRHKRTAEHLSLKLLAIWWSTAFDSRQGKEFFPSPQCLRLPESQPDSYPMSTVGKRDRSLNMTTYIHVTPKLNLCRVLPPVPLTYSRLRYRGTLQQSPDFQHGEQSGCDTREF
jgi:hypothetical protein